MFIVIVKLIFVEYKCWPDLILVNINVGKFKEILVKENCCPEKLITIKS